MYMYMYCRICLSTTCSYNCDQTIKLLPSAALKIPLFEVHTYTRIYKYSGSRLISYPRCIHIKRDIPLSRTVYICSIRTAPAHMLPRANLPCSSGCVYACQRLAKASTSTCLSTHSTAIEINSSRECAELSLFRLCLLSTIRCSNVL